MTIRFDRSGSGRALVLIHGVGTTRAVWARATPLLARERTVVAPDLPGFGESPGPGSGYDLADVADRMVAGLGRELDGPFDLLGHSLGGAVALTITARHPDLVRSLVLSAPGGFAPRSPLVARAAGAFAGPALALRRLVGAPTAASPLARRVLLAAAVGDGARLEPEVARELYRASLTATALGPAVASVARADLEPELRRIGVAFALLWGERDRLMPISTIERIRAIREPRAIVRIDDAGHIPQIEFPQRFADAVLEALAAVTDS